MIKFLFEGAPVRGAVVQSSDEWQNMIRFHKYPENVASLLGQFAAGALLLSSTIKFDGALILQVKGSGPIQLICRRSQNTAFGPALWRSFVKVRKSLRIWTCRR